MNVNVSNTKELKSFMEKSGADSDYYSIYPDDNFFQDTVCYICPKGKGWEIGIYERGSSHHVHQYDTEARACQGFLEEIYPELLTDEK